MAEVWLRWCPRCSAEIGANQHFCAKCGLNIATHLAEGNKQLTSGQVPQTLPPSHVDQSPPSQSEPAPVSQPIKKRRIGRMGFVLILLLILVLVGTGGYFSLLNFHMVQPDVTTTTIGASVTYAGVEMTVLNVEQSQSLMDDPHTSHAGMVRLDIQVQNKTTGLVNLIYNKIIWLLLPDRKLILPTYIKANGSLAPGSTQMGFVDFAVPSNIHVNQLTLRLGAADEAQMDIPLKEHANLSAYLPKTTKLSQKMQYQGLNWTLVSATSQLSLDSQQASKGVRYLTIGLTVDNPLSQMVIIGSAYDYMRLNIGNLTMLPKQATVPISFKAGASGQTGTVAFLAPQDATAFTFILLSQSGFDQATVDFNI